MEDSVSLALSIGEELLELKEKCGSIEGFVRRARDFPSLVLGSGLVPSLTFYLSKVDDYTIFSSKETICNDIKDEGYGTLLYFVLKRVSEITGLNICLSSDKKNVLECLKKVRENELKLQAQLMPFLIELKKVSEVVGD